MKRSASSKKSVSRKGAAKSSRRFARKSGNARHARKSTRPLERLPIGFVTSQGAGGLIVPERVVTPVPAGKLRSGMREVRRQIDDTLDELLQTLTGNYEIKEIKLVASFNADGKFLGFGVGGAASLEITICPCDD